MLPNRQTGKRKTKSRIVTLKSRQPPFSSTAFLTTAGDGRTALKFFRSQKLFAQGQAADAIFYVRKGCIKVTVTSQKGKEAVVALVEKGEFCGEGCLSGQMQHSATAVAFTDCDITRIEKSVITRMLRKQPAFAAFVLERCLRRAIRLQEDLVDQLHNSSEKRLARALLILGKIDEDGTSEPFRISQMVLADMIGTTRSRVSFFMNRFRMQGLIAYKGSVTVNNSLLSAILDNESSRLVRDMSGHRARE